MGGRRTLIILGVLVLAGLVLRVLMMVAYQPGFLGYPDSPVYITGASGELFWDRMRVVGYPAFLRGGHALSDDLSLTILIQHGLGVATALLLYGAVRRIGGPPWLGLVPAAVVLLGGDQLFFEHAVLTEGLYTFLTSAGIYAAARCLDGSRLAWPAVAGAMLGLAASVRLGGISILPLVAVWLLAVPAAAWRERLMRTAAAAVAGGLIVFGYLALAHDQTGEWSFSRHGVYNFYGRTATFADCSKFEPPRLAEPLCDDLPQSQRPSAQWYIFNGPVVTTFGQPQLGEPTPESLDSISVFARRAALHQPLDWLEAAGRDFARYVSPGSFKTPAPTPTTEDYAEARLFDAPGVHLSSANMAGYWSSNRVHSHKGLLERLRDYAWATRIEGPWLAVLLVLALLAPLATRGRHRAGALLLGGIGWALLLVPVLTMNYDGRFAVPTYGFVAGAAAFGAWGLASAVAARRRGAVSPRPAR